MGGRDKSLILGVNLAGGAAYLGVVECPDIARLDLGTDRLIPAESLAGAERLNDFRARFEQELRTLKPVHVALMGTRRYRNWAYGDAFARASLEAAIMIGAAATEIQYTALRQEDAAKAVGVPVTDLRDRAATVLGVESVPRYWKDRGLAFLASLGVAKGAC